MRQTDNSSSSSSVSSPPPPPPPPPHLSNSSLHLSLLYCIKERTGIFIFTAFSVTNLLLLLPLLLLVLCVARRRWRTQRSVTLSHADFFTYNMVAMELMGVAGSYFFCCGAFADVQSLVMGGLYLICIASSGQTLFHLLTCVERYLAVVHPVTYLGLRQAGGVRVRNISTGCAWLVCLVGVGFTEEVVRSFSSVLATCFWVASLVVVSFCSLSVLCALIHPRPGEGGGDREWVDQSKRRAFNTIMAILGALLLRLVGDVACVVIYSLSVLGQDQTCALLLSVSWFSLPSRMVLPLLFLHRAQRLPGCNHNTDSG